MQFPLAIVGLSVFVGVYQYASLLIKKSRPTCVNYSLTSSATLVDAKGSLGLSCKRSAVRSIRHHKLNDLILRAFHPFPFRRTKSKLRSSRLQSCKFEGIHREDQLINHCYFVTAMKWHGFSLKIQMHVLPWKRRFPVKFNERTFSNLSKYFAQLVYKFNVGLSILRFWLENKDYCHDDWDDMRQPNYNNIGLCQALHGECLYNKEKAA